MVELIRYVAARCNLSCSVRLQVWCEPHFVAIDAEATIGYSGQTGLFHLPTLHCKAPKQEDVDEVDSRMRDPGVEQRPDEVYLSSSWSIPWCG